MNPEEITQKNLGELFSDLLGRGRFETNQWDVLMGSQRRGAAYRRLAEALGPRYERATLESYRIYDGDDADGGRMTQRHCKDAVENFCATMPERLRDGGGLVFFGRPGTGKDHFMAACMYWAILRHGWTVEWRDGPMLAQEIREVVGGAGTERELVDRYVEPLILAISDPVPPKGDASQWVTDTLQRIVDRRYRAQKSTWATVNVHDGAELERRLAAPLVDRLRHGSLCLSCVWDSYRTRSCDDHRATTRRRGER